MDKNPLEKKSWFSLIKLFSIIITAAMAAADFFTLRSLFIEMIDPTNANVLAFIMAAALEGLPFYLGMIHSEKLDDSRYLENDRKVAKRGFWIALLTLLGVMALNVAMRVMWIHHLEETGEISGDDYWEELIPQIFMSASPAATSLLAYVASWFAFRNRYEETKYEEVVKKMRILSECEENYHDSYDAYQRARISLWSSLEDADGKEAPKDSETYRKECFARIRSKLIANCITCYPTQIERYTQEVNKELEKCILEMATHTPLPQSISRITLADIIAEHDAEALDYADCWDYNYAGPDLEAELRSTLDNAVVAAQFETVIRHNSN